jgi:hypothetical protein
LFDATAATAVDDTDAKTWEGGQQGGSICQLLACLKLTVLLRDVGRSVLVLVLVMLVVLYLLDDLVEKVVEKLVRVLVHDAAEVLVPIAKLVDECTWSNGTLINWVLGNEHVEGAERGEEGRWR